MVNMKKLRISIGIPAYNEGGNIARLLRSVLGQKKRELIDEIIVISDGSSDNTVSEVKTFND